MTVPRFAGIVLDVDSTVCGIEGIDWLARRRGGEIAQRIEALTDDAMRGAIPLEEVYGRRLATVQPTREDVAALADAYVGAIAADCGATVGLFRRAGIRVVLVSGGLRPALLAVAQHLGLDGGDLHAVEIRFDAAGHYAGFDESSPLTTSNGKGNVVAGLGLPRPVLAVGDGNTDLAMRPVVDAFAAFTGFVSRARVVREADHVVGSFRELAELVYGA